MPDPSISIVIPVWNRRELFEATLRNLREQTFADWECIVVDDGSTDGTVDMVSSLAATDPRIRIVPKPPDRPKGPSASRNVGLAAARGRLVHFFDSDDLLAADFYEVAFHRMEDASLDFFATGIRWFVDGEGLSDDWDLLEGEAFQRQDFVARAVATRHRIWTQNVVWRRALLLGLPAGYREDLSQVEDLEFAVRAMLAASRFDFDDGARVLIRRHANSLTLDPSPRRDLSRRLSNDEVYRLILGHLDRAGASTPWVVDYCLVERYRHLTWAARLGLINASLLTRGVRLLKDLALRRPGLGMRFLLLAPVFLCRGLAIKALGKGPLQRK